MKPARVWKVAIVVGLPAVLAGTAGIYFAASRLFSPPAFDRTGGYTILCEVGRPGEHPEGGVMDDVCRGLLNRLDPKGRLGIVVRRSGDHLIEIRVPVPPTAPVPLDPGMLIRLVEHAGILEFRIAAKLSGEQEHRYRRRLAAEGPDTDGDGPYRWYVVDDPDRFSDDSGLVSEWYAGKRYLLLSDMPDLRLTRQERDWDVEAALATEDMSGRPALDFQLNQVGAERLAAITTQHIGRHLAVLLDDRVLMAPVIRSGIGGRGRIEGNLTFEDVRRMELALNARLPTSVRAMPETVEWIRPSRE